MKINSFFIKIQRDSCLFSCVINFIILICMVLFFYARYNCELDIAMQSLLYGVGSGGWNSAHLLFSNVFLGGILSIAARAMPLLAWYTIFHYTVVFISLVVFDMIIIKHNDNYIGRLVSVMVSIFLGYECYILPMYMKTAALASCSIVLMLGYTLFQKKYKKQSGQIWNMMLMVMLSIVASWISFSAFITMFFLSFLCIIVYGLINKKKFANKILVSKTIIIILLATLFFCLADQCIYNQSTIWAEAGEYRKDIEKLYVLGIPPYDKMEEVLESDGFSKMDEADYERIRRGLFLNNNEELEIIKEATKYKGSLKTNFISFFENFFMNIFSTGIFYLWIALALLLIYMKSLRASWINILISFLMIVVFSFNVHTYNVQWMGLLIYMPAIVLLVSNKFDNVERKNQYLWIYLGLFGILLFNRFSNTFVENVERNENMENIRTLQDNINNVQIIDFNYYIQGFTIYKPYPKLIDVGNTFLLNGIYQVIPGFRNIESIINNEQKNFDGYEIYGRDNQYIKFIEEKFMSDNINSEEYLDTYNFQHLIRRGVYRY